MTEYDYSPEAYEQHLATQLRISRWAEANSQYPPENPFATPVASSVATSRPSTPHRHQRQPGFEASLPHVSPSIHSSDSRRTKNSRSAHTPSSRSRSRSRAHAAHVESTPPPPPVPQKDSKTNLPLKFRRQTPYYPDQPTPASVTSHAPSSGTQVAAEGQELGYVQSQPTLPEAPEAIKYLRSHGAQSHSSSRSRSDLRRMQSQPFLSNDRGLPPVVSIPHPPPYTEASQSWYRPRTKSQPDHFAKGKSQGTYPASPKLHPSGFTSPTCDPAGKSLASSPYTQMNSQGSYPVPPFQMNGYPCPTSLDMSAAVPGYTTVYPDPTRSTRIKSSSKHNTVVPINGGRDGYVVLPASKMRARVFINPPSEQKQELPPYQDEKQAHMYMMPAGVFEDNQVMPKKSKGLLGRLRGGFSSCADLSGKN